MSALVHNLYNDETIGQWQHAGVLDFEADARRGAQPIQANP